MATEMFVIAIEQGYRQAFLVTYKPCFHFAILSATLHRFYWESQS